jgi:VIT1/CCC1 family predicted Fe2+/Mn2+ transporter
VDVNDLPKGTVAGIASFLAFGIGAFIPLIPYFFELQALFQLSSFLSSDSLVWVR